MLKLITRRLLTAIPTLLAIIILSFLLMRFAPGGPFDGERPLAPETKAALEAAYGLDKPIWQQVWLYLSRIVQGDFGPSLVYRDFTVTELITQSLPISSVAWRAGVAVRQCAWHFGRIVAAVRAGRWSDQALMLAATLLTALPTFVTGPLLAMIFGLWLGWLPVSGQGEGLAWLVLPVIALALPVAGAVAKLARAGLAEILGQDHIRAARARGLSPTAVLRRHALRPALVPVASYLGPAAASLLTGAVVIETVFGFRG